jgi:hypothetical protein
MINALVNARVCAVLYAFHASNEIAAGICVEHHCPRCGFADEGEEGR